MCSSIWYAVDPVSVVQKTDGKFTLEVADSMTDAWAKYFGPPVTVIVDLGPEFTGKDFPGKCDTCGIFVHFCDSKAPWQNARAERHGDMMKEMITEATFEQTPADLPAWLQLELQSVYRQTTIEQPIWLLTTAACFRNRPPTTRRSRIDDHA